jgi:hypothetical protein
MSSLESPTTIDGSSDIAIRFNMTSSKFINVSMDTLGDLYNKVTWRWLPLGNNKLVVRPSIPLDVKHLYGMAA